MRCGGERMEISNGKAKPVVIRWSHKNYDMHLVSRTTCIVQSSRFNFRSSLFCRRWPQGHHEDLQCKLKKLTRVKTKQPMTITDTPGAGFEKVALDLVGPFPTTEVGNKWILTMQCLLTKFCIGAPLPDATVATVANAFLKRLICVHGTPKVVLTDQGTNFCFQSNENICQTFAHTSTPNNRI